MTTFNKILVPLDGSEFSEHALTLVKAIQTEPAKTLSLLRVINPTALAAQGTAIAEAVQAAQTYINERCDGFGPAATGIVREAEDAAEQILAEAADHDLLALMTHGHSGVKRWTLGSVAERVLRHSSTPVLSCNPGGKLPQAGQIDKILVALDGSEHAASVLGMVSSLAQDLDAEVILFSAAWVDPTDNVAAYSMETAAVSDSIAGDLGKHAESLRQQGVKKVTFRVELDYPPDAILEAVERTDSDLVVMTTHGRTGLRRWVLGSVAEKILRENTRPTLLVRIPAEQLR